MKRTHNRTTKTAAEDDVVYDRRHYCYLVNHSAVHKIKKQMSRRSRHEEKLEIKRLQNEL